MTAMNVVKMARNEVGYRESGNNKTKYAPAVKGLEWSQNQPWCSTFTVWVFQKAGLRDLVPVTASCEVGANWFKKLGQFSQTPRVGSLVYYGPNGGTHVEIVSEVAGKNIRTIGGNTSGSLNGVYHNGDGVYEKWVSRDSSRIHGYGHPKYSDDIPAGNPIAVEVPNYPGSPIKPGSRVKAVKVWQARMKARGWTTSINGIHDAKSVAMTKAFQKEKGLAVDGIVGPVTWNAAWIEPIT